MLRIPMIIFMAWLLWLSPIDGARTYIVDDSGFANYGTIQEAVVAASNGDTIYIKPGAYNEEIMLNKSLTLMPLTGETEPVILKGDGLETGITITSDGCSLEGMTFQDFSGAAIYIQSGKNIVQDNVFQNANPAILVRGSDENLIAGNIITESQGAVALWEDSSDNLVQENDISGCNVSILVREAENNKIIANRISEAVWGIWLYNASSCRIEGNDIKSQLYGIWLLNSSAVNVSENKVSIENSDSSISQGIYLANSRVIELLSNEINGGFIGLVVSESRNNRLTGNTISGSVNSVLIKDSEWQEMKNNQIKAVEFGLRMENSSRNAISQNRIENCTIGIDLGTSRQNNITENQISSTKDTALQMAYSGENTFSFNQISDSFKGVILLESSANRLQANRFQNVEWCLYAEGETREGFNNSIDESNVVDGVPIVYLFGQSGGQIENKQIAHLTLAYCENVTVKNTAITNDAIFLFDSKDNKILENDISGCFGMRLLQSDENDISGNRLIGNRYSGMFLYGSDLNQIAGNNASRNSQNGISLLSCNENAIFRNVLDGNLEAGIWLNLSNDNQVYQNNISRNPLGMQAMLSTGKQSFTTILWTIRSIRRIPVAATTGMPATLPVATTGAVMWPKAIPARIGPG
jgi:parallel beta-helix repeat protein